MPPACRGPQRAPERRAGGAAGRAARAHVASASPSRTTAPAAPGTAPAGGSGMGLVNMRERVAALGGSSPSTTARAAASRCASSFRSRSEQAAMLHGIRVMLVDDHAVVREGYRRLIEKHRQMMVVAEAADGDAAYSSTRSISPTWWCSTCQMPGRGGIEVIRHLRQRDEGARMLVFTMHQNAAYALQAFQAGAKGYITKWSAPELSDRAPSRRRRRKKRHQPRHQSRARHDAHQSGGGRRTA